MSHRDDPVEIIAGLPRLGGPEPALRVLLSGTWEPPVYITAALPESSASITVIHPGQDLKEILSKVIILGIDPYPSPSRRELRGPLAQPGLFRLTTHLTTTAWTLGDREIRGTDGYWLTIEVYDPTKGHHRATAWCPPADAPCVKIARDMMDAALPVDPTLAERSWVETLRSPD